MIVTTNEINTFLQAATGVTVPSSVSTLLTLAAPFIQQSIEKVIGSPIETATVTEYYPVRTANSLLGDDPLIAGYDLQGSRVVSLVRGDQARRVLTLSKKWVRSIGSIYENYAAWDTAGGSFPDSSLLSATDYYLDISVAGLSNTSRVIRTYGAWSNYLRTIKVTYTHGLSQAEIDASYMHLKLALLTAIQSFAIGTVLRSTAVAQGGLPNSVSMTDFSVTIADPSTMGLYFAGNYTLPSESVALLSREINVSNYF